MAKQLRGLRAQERVSQKALAESIGGKVSQSHVSQMLLGNVHIDLDQLDGMCAALGTRAAVVVRDAEADMITSTASPDSGDMARLERLRKLADQQAHKIDSDQDESVAG